MKQSSGVFVGVIFILVLAMIACGGPPSPLIKPDPKGVDWYVERYPFMQEWGKVFVFETEFDWPTGYTRPDSALLTPYAFWASHFPLWHKDRPVVTLRRGLAFTADEISRSIPFTWRTNKLSDVVIPLQMLSEYYLYRRRAPEMIVLPISGETMTYSRWLESSITYGPRKTVRFNPGPARDATDREYNLFVSLLADNVTYGSLIRNCIAVDDAEVVPGDLFIATDSIGAVGKVYVVLCMLTNRNNEKIYAVGTGCTQPCDFHIPLFNDNRRNPWLGIPAIRQLTPEFESTGFYRLRFSRF